MRRLLLLMPTKTYRATDFLSAALALETEVVVGSNRRQALETLSGGRTITLNFKNLEKGTAQILAYAREHPIDSIVSVDEDMTILAAKASAALDLPHNSPESVEAAKNKYRLRQLLSKAGVPSPDFTLLSIHENPSRAAKNANYPCVLKPLALSASRGVIRADDPEGFVSAFRRIVKILREPDAGPAIEGAADHILVERYIPGGEVAVEGLLTDGRLHVLAIFDKPDPLEGPYFEETIYVTPSRLPESIQADLAAVTSKACEALGLRGGPVHAELRINDGGPWVIELAARSIGGLCSRVLRFGAGIRLEEVILRHALRLPIDSLERERQAGGVMMIPIPRGGILRRVRGLDEARMVPGVEGVTISIPVGQRVVPLPEGRKYLGFLFARGETPAAVESALREAHRRIEFVIEPRSSR